MATPITIGAAGGEYMESVVVVEWRVKPGDTVKAGEVVAVVETAKAATEVTAPCDGTMGRILAEEGAEVGVKDPIGLIGEGEPETDLEAAQEPAATAPAEKSAPAAPVAPRKPGRVVASPVARKVAAREGMDLAGLAGTGPRGRIKRRDVEAALRGAGAAPEAASFAEEAGPLAVTRGGGGEGAPILLIHGFASDAMVWRALERALGKSRPVIRVELPCHGHSPKRRIGSFRELARAVTEAVDALDAGPVHFVGHSLGGAVALALADTRPQTVRSLMLVAPAGLGPEMEGAIAAGLCRAARVESLAPWLKRLVGDPAIVTEKYAAAAMQARADAGLRAAQTALADVLFPDGTQAMDLTAALSRVAAPARIVWGKADALLPWRHALAAPGTVALHLLDGIGHMPHVEAPETVARILQDLIAAAECGRQR